MVVHVYTPRSEETDAGGLQVQDRLRLLNETVADKTNMHIQGVVWGVRTYYDQNILYLNEKVK